MVYDFLFFEQPMVMVNRPNLTIVYSSIRAVHHYHWLFRKLGIIDRGKDKVWQNFAYISAVPHLNCSMCSKCAANLVNSAARVRRIFAKCAAKIAANFFN